MWTHFPVHSHPPLSKRLLQGLWVKVRVVVWGHVVVVVVVFTGRRSGGESQGGGRNGLTTKTPHCQLFHKQSTAYPANNSLPETPRQLHTLTISKIPLMKFRTIYTANYFGSRHTFIHDNNKNYLFLKPMCVIHVTQVYTFYLWIYFYFFSFIHWFCGFSLC